MSVKWLYENYLLTAVIVVYFGGLSGYGTYAMFTDITLITGAAATAYATLMGLPAIAVGLVKWRAERAK